MNKTACVALMVMLAAPAAAENSTADPRLGLGWHYETSAFEAVFTHFNRQDSNAGVHPMGGDAASPVGALLAWRPGPGDRLLRLGADLTYALHMDYDGASKEVFRSGSFVGFHDLTVYHLAFKPKLYLSGRVLGLPADSFRPYFGAALNYYLLDMTFDAENFKPLGGQPKEERFAETALTGIAPLAGAEIRLGRRFSAFAEVAFNPELKMSSAKSVLVSDVELSSLARASAGTHWSFGLKWFPF